MYVVDWMNRNHQAPLSRAPFLGIQMMVSCRWPLRCPAQGLGIFESTMPFSDQEKAEKENTSLAMCFQLFFPPLRCCRFRLSEKLYQLVSWLHHHLDANMSNDITPESTEYIQARQLKSTRLLMNFALKLHRLIQSTTGTELHSHHNIQAALSRRVAPQCFWYFGNESLQDGAPQ